MKGKVASTYRERKVDNSVKPVVALRSVSRVARDLKLNHRRFYTSSVVKRFLYTYIECVSDSHKYRAKSKSGVKMRERERDKENLTQRDKLDSYFSIRFLYTYER